MSYFHTPTNTKTPRKEIIGLSLIVGIMIGFTYTTPILFVASLVLVATIDICCNGD